MQHKSITITKAADNAAFEAAKALFIEYQQSLGIDLCFQSFDAELEQLSTMYAPPDGALLLVSIADDFAGCVAVRRKSADVCEMKRLFVKDAYKGKGLGRMLGTAIMKEAENLGYKKMILDTLDTLKPALSLYYSMGFTNTIAYYNNPLSGVIYLQKQL